MAVNRTKSFVICEKPLQIRLKQKYFNQKCQHSVFFFSQESTSSWLDSVIVHLADIIALEDTPSIQMEVGLLVKEFPDIR